MIESFDEQYWLTNIVETSKIIDMNLESATTDNRPLVASNILSHLRDFTESIVAILYLKEKKGINSSNRYKIIEDSLDYIKSIHRYNFLYVFHNGLQITSGHITLFGEYAERMILKYVDYLVQTKVFLLKECNVDVLKNLNKLPLDLDDKLSNYYKEIGNKLNIRYGYGEKRGTYSFYIQKKKTIFIEGQIFYEYTLTNAFDDLSKFDRFIAFSKLNIFASYAIRCKFAENQITVFNKKVGILIISDYWVSIRPCELEHFGNILGLKEQYSRTQQYERLMSYIANENKSLSNIVLFEDSEFDNLIDFITENKGNETALIRLLKKARLLIKNKITGSNVLVYLLAHMHNSVLKNQMHITPNKNISDLYLKNGVLVFERTPLSASLIKHNPDLSVLFSIFNNEELLDEIFAREIASNSNKYGTLYYNAKDIDINFLNKMISKYNSRIPDFLPGSKIEQFGRNIFIKQNENATIFILNKLLGQSKVINFRDYNNYVKSRLDLFDFQPDDPAKLKAIETMFVNSSLFCIYGAAGTGKSTLISHELNVLGKISKLCLANTHPAVQNMKRKINDDEARYMTISSYLYSRDIETDWDILVLDECSNISTKDMADLLRKIKAKLIILSGDIYQLPSIQFGNWFALIRKFINDKSFIDLDHTYRSDNCNLLTLWKKVRNIDSTIQDTLTACKISNENYEEIFTRKSEDEIILCLNYDGLFGINNLNKLLQINNPYKEYRWRQYIFKPEDPIIFNETERFNSYLYNNLKGKIKDIAISENKNITFILEVDTVLNPLLSYEYNGFTFIKTLDNGKSLIELTVFNSNEDDFDKDTSEWAKIPFQIAYAVSIHKAQGLEYDSVKIVITSEVEEDISHNIFYTAITRAKKDLCIYWSPESEKRIISSFQLKNVNRDVSILSSRAKLKIVN